MYNPGRVFGSGSCIRSRPYPFNKRVFGSRIQKNMLRPYYTDRVRVQTRPIDRPRFDDVMLEWTT